jgi:hypothetical protein
MNKFKFLSVASMILLAAFFTACEDDEVFDPPVVTLNQGPDVVLDEGVETFTLTGTVESAAGLSEVNLLEVTDDGNFILESVTTFADPNTYSFDFMISGITDRITVAVEAIDTELQATNSMAVTIVYTPVPETPLTEAEEATWQRVGGQDGTGLGMFGLAWTSNVKSISAVIRKDDADKFVQLTEADWEEITTLEALTEKVEAADDMDDYRGVSAEQDDIYNHVLATVVGDQYFLILVKSATVTFSAETGTTISISVEYKTVEPEE